MKRLNLVLLALLALVFAGSLMAGRIWVDPLHPALPGAGIILAQLRLPRSVLACVVGAGLGGSGAAMQGYLRNPLADPGLFGIGPAAALGAVISLWLGASGVPLPVWALPLFALVGAGVAMAMLALIAGREGSVALFTLAGLMVSSMAGALTSLVISLAPSPFALSEIVAWMLGALADRSWADVWVALPLVSVGLVVLRFAGHWLDAMSLGEMTARSLGVDPRALAGVIVVGVGLCVGASVASAGVIGFVGLVVPHVMRGLTDRRPSSLLVPSALGGALVLLLADCACRLVPLAGGELRLGIALSLLGVPFFLWLLWGIRRSGQWGGWG